MVYKSCNGTANNTSSNDTCAGRKGETGSESYLIPVEVVVVLFIFILMIDLLGNTVVVLIVTLKRKMQTFTNWLILNLAIADLSVAFICIPLEIPIEITKEWVYGKFFCTIFYPLQSATIYASVFTLVALSCSRYWAIIHPFKRQPTPMVAKVIIVIVWASSFCLTIPYMLALHYRSDTSQCVEVWSDTQRRFYTVATVVVQYILPLALVTMAYAFIIHDVVFRKHTEYEHFEQQQENKKLIKLLIVITTTFGVCVLPYHMVALFYEFGNLYNEDVSLASYILLYLNSALNPIMYNVFSSSFREEFSNTYKMICSYGRNSKTRVQRSDTTTTLITQDSRRVKKSMKKGGGDGGVMKRSMEEDEESEVLCSTI